MEQLHGFGDAVEQVMNEIREKFKEASRNTGVFESLKSFAAAVDWSEPWIIGLLGFQALIFAVTIRFRSNLYVSGAIMVFAASVIYGGERLNRLCGQHWKKFAGQPYFDKNGIFFGAIVSAPLLFTMFFILVNYLISSSSLLIKVKRSELIHKARQRAAREKAEHTTEGQKKEK